MESFSARNDSVLLLVAIVMLRFDQVGILRGVRGSRIAPRGKWEASGRRMRQMRFHLFVLAAVFVFSFRAAGQATTQSAEPTARTTTRPATTQAGEKGDRLVVTEHELKVGDRVLRYTATAGTMAQKDESGATKADMFFVAYTLNRVDGDGDGDVDADDDGEDRKSV